jgi:hypothetical protein
MLWNESTKRWIFDPQDFTGSWNVDGTYIEGEQITIGDGTTKRTYTIGVNATNFDDALNKAIADLSSGGKIFVKRGDYTTSGNTYSTNGIMIHGEGFATNITTSGSISVEANNWTITNVRLTANTGVTALELSSGNSARCIVEKVYFEENGAATDIAFDGADNHVIANCISTTTTTNLP